MATYEFETVTSAGIERQFMEIETVNEDERVGFFKNHLGSWDEQLLKRIFRGSNGNSKRDTALKNFTMEFGGNAYDYYKGMFFNLSEIEADYESSQNGGDHKAEIDSLRAQIEQLQSDLADKADQSVVDGKADQGSVDSLATRVDSVESEVNDHETRIGTLESSAS